VAVGDVTRKRWFLPETPDVLGMLRRQMAVTIDGVDAFARWAGGAAAAAQAVRDAEHLGDVAKRDLLGALREAFVTPIEPEDLFALSRGIDRILNYASDLVEESEAMASPPDEGIATIAGLLGEALRHLDDALSTLGTDGDHATASADAAIAAQHQLETACYAGMVGLLSVEDRSERITRRELYRRSSRIGEAVVDVAERIVYAVVKQS
jgi:uncharacterized protein Yka (UPF0111/DUF47 family)